MVIGGSLTLFAVRAPTVKNAVQFSWLSRETLLLINNVMLTISAATVLLGTLFPLIMESLNLGMISVGAPYFNTVFIPMALILFFALGLGVLLNWKSGTITWLIQQIRWIALASMAAATAFSLFYADHFSLLEWLGMASVAWITLIALKDIRTLWQGLKRLKPAFYGMHLAHIGLAVATVGVIMVTGFSTQRDLRMAPNEHVELSGYRFTFQGVRSVKGPNYTSDLGTITVSKNGSTVARLHPEKRIYSVQAMPMTETGIDAGLTRDLYVVLGEPLDNKGSWSVRVHVKPFVRWIWFGALLMGLGGILAVMDRRYRKATQPTVSTSALQGVQQA